MNDHDRENYNFMLNADTVTLREWYGSLSEDDVAYAHELLMQGQVELDMRIVELCDNVTDLTEANSVLARFRI